MSFLIKQKFSLVIILLGLLAIFQPSVSYAQSPINDSLLFRSGSSVKGNFILFHTAPAFRMDTSMASNTAYFVVERTTYDGNANKILSFKKIAEVKPVSTKNKLQSLFNENEIAELLAKYKLKSIEELLNLFARERSPKFYKALYSDIRFQEALGHTWIDDKVEIGATYVYKATRVDNQGTQSLFGYAIQTAMDNNRGLLRFNVSGGEVQTYTDSVIAFNWELTANSSKTKKQDFTDKVLKMGSRNESDLLEDWDDDFLRFRMYIIKNGIMQSSRLNRGIRDSIIEVRNTISTRRDDEIMAWVVPEDIFGNQGIPLDTIFAYSVSASDAPIISSATTREIVDAVQVSWPKLPEKPYIKGVRIQRYNNEDILEDVATLPASDTSFNDYNVVIGQQYRYQVRALFAKSVSFTQEIPAQCVGSYTTFSKPMPPINLSAKEEGKNIRLDWDGSKVKGLYGYHVYRGYDGTAPTLLAGPITEATNYVDTSAELSGKSVYTYYVLTENLRQEVSLPSEPVHIKPNRTVKVYPPATVQTYYAHGRVNLTWDDARKMDSYIIGYQVQRRAGKTGNYENLGAVVTFAQTIDSAIAPGILYEYRVASIGSANEVSKYSDGTQFELPLEKDFSKVSLSLRNTHKGVAINWPAIERPAQKQYVLYRRTTGVDKMEVLATLPLGTSNYTDESVNEGKSYVYAIALEFDDATTGPLSNTVSIKHKPAAKPEILK